MGFSLSLFPLKKKKKRNENDRENERLQFIFDENEARLFHSYIHTQNKRQGYTQTSSTSSRLFLPRTQIYEGKYSLTPRAGSLGSTADEQQQHQQEKHSKYR